MAEMTGPGDINTSVSPQALKSFLIGAGWNLARSVRQNAEIWTRDDDQILVPLNSEAPDYSRRVRNFIEDLARARSDTEEDIARELMYVEDDVIDIRLADIKDVLPLTVATQVIMQAKELTIASACSVIARKESHGRSRPLKARSAANIVGMGHTRRDCFIIPLVSPTAGLRPMIAQQALDLPTLDLGLGREEHYFSRRVAGVMASSLESIRNLVKPSAMPAREELQQAVLVEGLSADACDAVADMVSTPGMGSLDVTFRWALTASPLRGGHETVDFQPESAGAIRHVGSLLRQRVTVDDAVLYGYVVSLDRDAGDPVGTVKVRAFVNGRVRPVKVTLNSDHYHVACEANDLRMRVVVMGKIRKTSSGLLTMSEVGSFQTDDYLPMVTSDDWAANVMPLSGTSGS